MGVLGRVPNRGVRCARPVRSLGVQHVRCGRRPRACPVWEREHKRVPELGHGDAGFAAADVADLYRGRLRARQRPRRGPHRRNRGLGFPQHGGGGARPTVRQHAPRGAVRVVVGSTRCCSATVLLWCGGECWCGSGCSCVVPRWCVCCVVM